MVSGIQIFQDRKGKLSPAGFVPLGSTGANGLTFLRGAKTLVVGVGDAGVAFLDVQDTIRGTAKPAFAGQGEGAGTFDVTATPDGLHAFSANEYGVVGEQRGNVGIVAVNPDGRGRVSHPETVGQIALGDVIPSLTLSPDGSRLYVATELVPEKRVLQMAGTANPKLTKKDCVQTKGTPARPNGFITVIDVRRAETSKLAGQDAILSRVAAGCSPVRLAETANASSIFVSARATMRFSSSILRCLSPIRIMPCGDRFLRVVRRPLVFSSSIRTEFSLWRTRTVSQTRPALLRTSRFRRRPNRVGC